MQHLSTSDVSRSMINATKGETKAITFPRDFEDLDFATLDFVGWRDPRIERRGYIAAEHHGELVAIMLTTQGSGAGTRRKAMCTICRAVDDGSNVALFAARRAGAPGRKGDSVGTYVCAGLDCSRQLRFPDYRAGRTQLDDGYADDDQRAAAMLGRLGQFIDSIG